MLGPLVSVIIPVYNGERYLSETLKSVFDQDYEPVEVIVVDDGSTDSTAHTVRSFEKVRYLYKENGGPSAARNTGIAVSRGEFIAFLDADDLWMPKKLSLQVGYLISHPEVDLVYAHRRMILEEGVTPPPWYQGSDGPGLFAGALLARKDVFDKAGLFNPEYRFGENAEWLARAKDAGISMDILPQTLLISRIHNHNHTYQSDKMRFHVLKALKSSIDRQRGKGGTK